MHSGVCRAFVEAFPLAANVAVVCTYLVIEPSLDSDAVLRHAAIIENRCSRPEIWPVRLSVVCIEMPST